MSKIIAVDFDGTLCENKWPEIGAPNQELIDYIKAQQKNGCKIILWTCRTDKLLEKAVKWCKRRKLTFDAVNENVPEILEMYETNGRKVYADEYIDDKANTSFALPFDDGFLKYQKHAMKVARDLNYGNAVYIQLKRAKSQAEICRIMNTERMRER